MFHPAEGQARVRCYHAVDEDQPGLDLVDEPCPLDGIVGPGARSKAERRRVGQADGLVDIAHTEERRDRSEQLFVVGGSVFGDVGQHRRQIVITRAIEPPSAGEQASARRQRLAHLLVEGRQDIGRRQGADVGRLIERVADRERLHRTHEAAFELVGDRLGDDEALGSDARLPVVDRARPDRRIDRRVEVGAWHDDKGVAAAKLEHRLLDSPAGCARHVAARRRAAGQGDRYHARVVDHSLDLIGPDQQSLEGALGEARAPDELFDRQGTLGHVGGVLEQRNVAGHQRGRGEAEDLPEWEVPGHHSQHGPQGLVVNVASRGVGRHFLIAEEALGVLGIVAAGPGAFERLLDRCPERLAHLGRHQAAKRFLLCFEDLCSARDHPPALRERCVPIGTKSVRRALEFLVDLGVGERLKRSEPLAGGRINARDRHRSSLL